MPLHPKQQALCDESPFDYSGLRALFLNCTLKPSPGTSHTRRLIDVSAAIMEANRVDVEVLRPVDYAIAPGVYKDMTAHGAATDDWPAIYEKVQRAHILVLGSPIWLGEKSSVCQQVIERLYATSSELNDRGQYAYYNRVGGCLITGNEDGIKHCSMGILYALQHLGYVIPPQADAGWIGEAGPGVSYGDEREDGARWRGQRLYPAQHHVHDLESDAPGPHDRHRWWHSGTWQSALRVGRRLPVRSSQP